MAKRSLLERTVQTLIINNKAIKKIDRKLEFIEEEHIFDGGRIDILAKKAGRRVAIELKAKEYATRPVAAQLMAYINYVGKKGNVYFVAPKVKYGVYASLEEYYKKGFVQFFEYGYDANLGFSFQKMNPSMMDDSRPFPKISIDSNQVLFTGKQKKLISKGVSLLVEYYEGPLKKEARFARKALRYFAGI